MMSPKGRILIDSIAVLQKRFNHQDRPNLSAIRLFQSGEKRNDHPPLLHERGPVDAIEQIEQRAHIARIAAEDVLHHLLRHFETTVACAQAYGPRYRSGSDHNIR